MRNTPSQDMLALTPKEAAELTPFNEAEICALAHNDPSFPAFMNGDALIIPRRAFENWLCNRAEARVGFAISNTANSVQRQQTTPACQNREGRTKEGASRLMTVKEFAESIKVTVKTARIRCNSKIFRDNKIARREGRDWKIDWDRYRKIVWGEK